MSNSKSNQEFLIEIKQKQEKYFSFINGNTEKIKYITENINDIENKIDTYPIIDLQKISNFLDNKIDKCQINFSIIEKFKSDIKSIDEFFEFEFDNEYIKFFQIKDYDEIDNMLIECIKDELEKYKPLIKKMNEKLEIFDELKILMREIDYFAKNNEIKWLSDDLNFGIGWNNSTPLEVRILSLRKILKFTPIELIKNYIKKLKKTLKDIKKTSKLIN